MKIEVKEAVKSAIKFGALRGTAHPILLMQFSEQVTDAEEQVVDKLSDAIQENTEAWEALDRDSDLVLEVVIETKDTFVAQIKEGADIQETIKTAILFGSLQYTVAPSILQGLKNNITEDEEKTLAVFKDTVNNTPEYYEAMDNDSETVLEVLNILKGELIKNGEKSGLIK